jgi:REP element-mobilizing transposase RayT
VANDDVSPHQRRSIRVPGYDYAHPGAYFVTICAQGRVCLFGEVSDGEMRLNEYGRIVEQEWRQTAILRPYIELDAFVVMPNHFHGILIITEAGVGARRALPLPTDSPEMVRLFGKPPAQALSSIVGSFKSAVSRRVNVLRGTPGAAVWQRGYYERIIRNERELAAVREYIVNNPYRWADDPDNPALRSDRKAP